MLESTYITFLKRWNMWLSELSLKFSWRNFLSWQKQLVVPSGRLMVPFGIHLFRQHVGEDHSQQTFLIFMFSLVLSCSYPLPSSLILTPFHPLLFLPSSVLSYSYPLPSFLILILFRPLLFLSSSNLSY